MEAALSLRSSGLVSLRRHTARPNWAARVGPSRVRPFRAEAASPPPEKKTARVVAVGAGVLLTCCLGAAYLHRGARAVPNGGPPFACRNKMEMSDEVDVLWSALLQRPWGKSGDCGSKTLLLGAIYEQMCRDMLVGNPRPKLMDLVYEQMRRDMLVGKPRPKLMDLVYERIKQEGYSSLVGMDSADKIMNLLCEEWRKFKKSEEKFQLGYLITQALIYQRNYTEAAKICEEILGDETLIPSATRPHLLYATIKMMLAVEKLQPREIVEGKRPATENKDIEKMDINTLVVGAREELEEYFKNDINSEKPPNTEKETNGEQAKEEETKGEQATKPEAPPALGGQKHHL